MDALGDIENGVSSYEGLGATGVIQALKQLKKPPPPKDGKYRRIPQGEGKESILLAK